MYGVAASIMANFTDVMNTWIALTSSYAIRVNLHSKLENADSPDGLQRLPGDHESSGFSDLETNYVIDLTDINSVPWCFFFPYR